MISLNSVVYLQPEGEWWNNNDWSRNWPRLQHWTAPKSQGPMTRPKESDRHSAEELLWLERLGLATVLISDSFCLALEDSRQMLLLLPKPERDWLNEPINQFGSLAWEGLKRPTRPIIRSVDEATAEPLTRTKEEVPLFVFGQMLSFKVASAGRLMFGLSAVSRDALFHRSDTGWSGLMSRV